MGAEEDQLRQVIEHQKKVVNIIHDVSFKVNASLDLDTIFETTFFLVCQNLLVQLHQYETNYH